MLPSPFLVAKNAAFPWSFGCLQGRHRAHQGDAGQPLFSSLWAIVDTMALQYVDLSHFQ